MVYQSMPKSAFMLVSFIFGYTKIKKETSNLHHTATTKYPCYVPVLGDSEGASCVAPVSKCKDITFFLTGATYFVDFFSFICANSF